MPKLSPPSNRLNAPRCSNQIESASQTLRIAVASLAVALVFASSASGEKSAPTSDPVLTIKTDTRRVVVDIVVTDPKGKLVTSLTKQDFSVFENNTPQAIHDFEFHTITSQPDYVPPKLPPLPPNTFVNLAAAPETGTPTVLLYDLLNTPLADQMYAHEELIRYLKHRRPGVQVAIFVLGAKLQMLQGFTDDETRLEAALGKRKGEPSVSPLIGEGPGESAETSAPSTITDTNQPATTATGNRSAAPLAVTETEIAAGLAHMESLNRSDLLDQRVEITLDALTQIGRFLSGLPGRKNLIWLSASFPSNVLPDASLSVNAGDHGQSTRNYTAATKQATDLLSVSHIAVYPVDVRGVQLRPLVPVDAANPGPGLLEYLRFSSNLAAERATMIDIAESTGGRAFYSNNFIDELIGDAMANGSTYYSLTYSPTDANFDGTLRHIKVKLKEAGYTLAYRRSYFADDLHKAVEEAADAPVTPLAPSLEHGTPLAHELFVEAHLDLYGDPVVATPQQMGVLSNFEAFQSKKKKSKGPSKPASPIMMQRYVVEYGLVPRQLQLPAESTGTHRSSLEVGVLSYDADGRKLNGIDSKIDDTIPATRFAHLDDSGYRVIQTIAVPVTATSLRLAVRDRLANRVGSLEVNLPLLRTPRPVQTLGTDIPAPGPSAQCDESVPLSESGQSEDRDWLNIVPFGQELFALES